MPRFRIRARRFWTNRRRRRRPAEASNESQQQQGEPETPVTIDPTLLFPELTFEQEETGGGESSASLETNDQSLQVQSAPIISEPVAAQAAVTDTDQQQSILDRINTDPPAIPFTDHSTVNQTSINQTSTESMLNHRGNANFSFTEITPSRGDTMIAVCTSQATERALSMSHAVATSHGATSINSSLVSQSDNSLPPTHDDSFVQSSEATERLPQRSGRATMSSTSELSSSSTGNIVTVLLRESDAGTEVYSRLLGTTVRSHVIHQPRRYHFIWSSDGTDSHLWSSPIRLRSYLSQFCTAVSRRVVPHGASIEVVLYPHLLANPAPGFTPISITRIYTMIHPIHPPTNWQTQFPTDFAGNWSSFVSDIGMNALAGPLIETPLQTSLPDTLRLPLSPPPVPDQEPQAIIQHHSSSLAAAVSEIRSSVTIPDTVESPPLDLSESSISHVSLPSSNGSTQSLGHTDSDSTTNTNTSAGEQLVAPPCSSNLHLEDDQVSNALKFRFPNLPNKGNHEYNLFVPPSYVLGPVIGEGEFAKVRMACNLVTNGAVAIKAFRRRRGGLSSSIDEQMLREINVLKGLRCRNIIKVFESLIYGDRVFMVMEIMTKGDLRKYINKTGAMKESNARKMFSDILNGVVYLHQHSIVHLDLKLENLLLNEDLVIKITDFGCARLQVGSKRFNTPCGSYAYGAPEVISGQSYDGMKADVWSLGIILYCMVSARLPYADDGQLADLIWERRQSPEIPSWVSSECCNLICWALRYRAERRINETQMMSHNWMWIDSRKLPWLKPCT